MKSGIPFQASWRDLFAFMVSATVTSVREYLAQARVRRKYARVIRWCEEEMVRALDDQDAECYEMWRGRHEEWKRKAAND